VISLPGETFVKGVPSDGPFKGGGFRGDLKSEAASHPQGGEKYRGPLCNGRKKGNPLFIPSKRKETWFSPSTPFALKQFSGILYGEKLA